ncbi:11257_t:CDS:10 [Diversispora eburnea]|uniref:11257_t:CDS:1 n=1 Tax=Diversispora eburnea TaxID=1213867 RepID=A0A9N8W0P2_9GLOM|nr:11257_t:CDS:10 [Diversispora eburnea]
MEDKNFQELLKDSDIIPVITVNPGTPQAEKAFGFDKVSITKSNDTISIDYRISNIDIIGVSPGEKYIVTWSRNNGLLAVWPTDQDSTKLSYTFSIKTRFDETVLKKADKIYVSVSEDGEYVAISKITIIGGENTETVNMDSFDSPISDSEYSSTTSFDIYSTNLNNSHHYTRLNSLEVTGPLIFVRNSHLMCFVKDEIYLVSTRSWKIINKINFDQLIQSAPSYSSDSNAFIIDIYDILINTLRYDYMVWPEDNNGLSVWDFEGKLKQWFYTGTKEPSHTLHSISHNGKTNTHGSKTKGILSLFHVPTALTIFDIQVPDSTFYISFVSKTEQILVCSLNEDIIKTQVYDCWSGMLAYEESCAHLSSEKPFLLLDENYIQVAEDNELEIYPLYQKLSTFNTEKLHKSQEWSTINKNLKLSCATESYSSRSLCWGYIHDTERHVLVSKFLIEPWKESEDNMFAKWLDDEGKRFLIVGKDSVQIYFTKTKGVHKKYLRLELQYMWTVPLTQDDAFINSVLLGKCKIPGEGNIERKSLQIQLSNNFNVTLLLPDEDELTSYKIISDACISIHYLCLQFPLDCDYFNRLAIRSQLKKLICEHVQICPSAFNKISLGDNKYIYPIEDFINLGWDDVVRTILENNQYIPLFHNDKQTESALSLLVELQKSELVNHFMEYLIRHLRERNKKGVTPSSLKIRQPGYAWTIGISLLDLFKYYPDKGLYLMKESSYFTTSLEAPVRILHTNLGDPYQVEERSVHGELSAVAHKAKLPRSVEQKVERYLANLMEKIGIHFGREKMPAIPKYKNYTDYAQQHDKIMDKLSWKESSGERERIRNKRLGVVQKTHPAKLCVVPWPDFCVFPSFPNENRGHFFKFWDNYISPEISPFANVALNGSSEMFSEVSMEALPGYFDELRQMNGRWNLPLATAILVVLVKKEPPSWLKCFSILWVWTRSLLQLRAFSGPGKFIAIVFEITYKIRALFFVLAFLVMVNPLDLVSQYSGNITNTNGEVIGRLNLTEIPQSSTNNWVRFDWSILATYSFLGIGWDAISNFEPSLPLAIMMFSFSAIAVVLLLNVLIGLISDVFNGSLQIARQKYLRQKAEIIAEIELFKLTQSQRNNIEWFPHLIYYEAHVDSINEWRRKLDQEEQGQVDVDFVRKELKAVKDELQNDFKVLRGTFKKVMNTPLDTYNKTTTKPIPLPTQWSVYDSSSYIKVTNNGLGLRCTDNSDAASIRTDHPIPRKAGLFYYEIDIMNKGDKGFIGLGLGLKDVLLDKMPGYHGDNGLIYIQHSRGKPYGPLFSEGDTIGCGVNFYDNTLFFTKNGVNLAYKGIDHGEFFPMIGLITKEECIEANFGLRPFKYDISLHAKMIFDYAAASNLHIEQELPDDYNIDDIMPPQFFCNYCGTYY